MLFVRMVLWYKKLIFVCFTLWPFSHLLGFDWFRCFNILQQSIIYSTSIFWNEFLNSINIFSKFRLDWMSMWVVQLFMLLLNCYKGIPFLVFFNICSFTYPLLLDDQFQKCWVQVFLRRDQHLDDQLHLLLRWRHHRRHRLFT